MAVRITSDSISSTQMMPGTMKLTLRSSGLNQTRGSTADDRDAARRRAAPAAVDELHVDRLGRA